MTELEALIRSIPDSYDGLFRGVRKIARKTGKSQEIVDYIKEKSPTASQLLEFACGLDETIAKEYEDSGCNRAVEPQTWYRVPLSFR